MTTAAAQGPARVPTPRPKAPPTSSVNPELATAVNNPRPTPAPAPASSSSDTSASPAQAGAVRRGLRTTLSDPLSDRTTEFLIRRTLCPQQNLEKGRSAPAPIEEILPPLTSRNDVDLQLYALIAIILREYVQNWYNKITPDEAFVAEIVQIIAHCTRALEQRLRKVDLESLLLDELPDLLDRHVTAYRAAHDPVTQPPVETDPREIYHSLCPLPALSPVPHAGTAQNLAEQAENEVAYRQLLVHAVLAVLLPTEDLENECLTALVGQIFSELIIGNVVANRLSEPWFIWEILTISSGVIARRRAIANDDSASGGTSKDGGGGGGGGGQGLKGSDGPKPKSFAIQDLFWTVLQWCFLATSFVRIAFSVVLSSRGLPARVPPGNGSGNGAGTRQDMTGHKSGMEQPAEARGDDPLAMHQRPEQAQAQQAQAVKRPVLAFRCWPAVANLIGMDVRMPWLCGALSILQWIAMTAPGQMAGLDGTIDRLLSHYIHRYLLDPSALPPLLRSVRGALFPNNMPGSSAMIAPSSDAELRALRRRCANALWDLTPKGVGRLYFGGSRGGGVFWATATSASSSSSVSASSSPPASATNSASAASSSSAAAAAASGAGAPEEKGSSLQQNQHGSGSRSGSSSSAGEEGLSSSSFGGRLLMRRSAPTAPQKKVSSSSSGDQQRSGSGGEKQASDSSSVVRSAQCEKKKDDTAITTDSDNKDDGKDEDEQRILTEIESSILDLFSDAYCNKHLIYNILELFLVRLMPELAEKGVIELWKERLA
ncbi:PXA domain-containing protein [Diplogelasinospora grovesii]|uniref:PXA domain-containing protein n=1 Tax=Diplogelasinospora grovesii TaxID=303347 RepID=A0AAN6S8T9_9PEZI|nr:PXA domain-containing protein [Diplogelasinospora grovesii]